MADETIRDIAADLRARAARAEAAAGFPTVEADNDRRLADRIEEAAKREHDRQYEPKCDWPIRDALALANTLANHGLRDGNADAASSCIYSLCRILSSPGNAAAMREALRGIGGCVEAAYGAPQHAGGYLAQINTLVRAALSAPARNCDKYGADGAAVACRKALGIDWSHIILVRKVIGWLFAKAEGKEDYNE